MRDEQLRHIYTDNYRRRDRWSCLGCGLMFAMGLAFWAAVFYVLWCIAA